jgi:small subunit ribosomal protein S10e
LNDISLTLIRKAVINAFDVLAAGEGREGGFRRGGDRDDYRRKEGASGEFKPEFRGGLGK